MAVASDTTCAFEAPAPLPAFSAADKATLDGTVKWTGKELLGLRNGCAQGGKLSRFGKHLGRLYITSTIPKSFLFPFFSAPFS